MEIDMLRISLCLVSLLTTTSLSFAQDEAAKQLLARFADMRPTANELGMYRLDWAGSLDEALQRAEKEHRPVFLIVIHAKYGDVSGRGSRPGMQSNVDLAVLDSKGQVVHWFDGFVFQNPGRRTLLEEYTERELSKAIAQLKLNDLPPRKNPLILPDLNQSRGVRVFVRLMDDRMQAYQAPVVEVVRLAQEDWASLTCPDKERSVNAASLMKMNSATKES